MMADVLIRNIDDKMLTRLKAIAEKNNRSLQGELHEMIRLHAGADIHEARSMVRDIIDTYKAENRYFTDSAADIREDRDR